MNNEHEGANKIDFRTNKFKDQFDTYVTKLLELRVRAEHENPIDIMYKMKHMLNNLQNALEKYECNLQAERSSFLFQEFNFKEPNYWDYCQICGTKVDEPEKRTSLCRMHTRP